MQTATLRISNGSLENFRMSKQISRVPNRGVNTARGAHVLGNGPGAQNRALENKS